MTILTGNSTSTQTLTADGFILNISNTASVIVTSGSAIDWSDATVNKKLIINGTVNSETEDGIITGSFGVATATNIVIGQTGSVYAKSNAYFTNGVGENLINNGSLTSESGSTLFVDGDTFKLLNNGSITSESGSGANLLGSGADITNNGDITSLFFNGISVSGNDAIIVNNGNIFGDDLGISVTGLAANITNNGSITGGIKFDAGADTQHTLVNHGVIMGDVRANGSDAANVTNTGKIFGDLVGDDANDIFVNRGYVSGAIATFGGNDKLFLTGGTFDGVAQGGAGNDQYFIDRTDIELFESNSIGTDEVFAAASFHLDALFENLTLEGKDHFYAIGNQLDNELTGNIGNNLIKGLAGADTIEGKQGDDILIGGGKNDGIKDIFVFSTGDERDMIRNFQAKGNGHDVIDLDNMISISNFNDLKNNHMSQSGKNVVIDALDGDVIILEGVKIGTLTTNDFLF